MTDISKEAVERVAAAIWPEIGTDYTYDEAVARANGLPDDYATQTYHQQAVKYAKDIARAAIAAMPDTKALEAADSISARLRSLSNYPGTATREAADHIDAQAARLAEIEAERDRQYDQNCEQIIRIAELEVNVAEEIRARDYFESVFSKAFTAATGREMVWSSGYGANEALSDITDLNDQLATARADLPATDEQALANPKVQALVEALITAERELQDAADYWDELCNDGARAPFTVAAKQARAALAKAAALEAPGKEPTT